MLTEHESFELLDRLGRLGLRTIIREHAAQARHANKSIDVLIFYALLHGEKYTYCSERRRRKGVEFLESIGLLELLERHELDLWPARNAVHKSEARQTAPSSQACH